MKLYTVFSFCIISFILFAPICADEDCKDKRQIDSNFRMAMTDDYFTAMIRPYLVREFRPWRYVAAPNNLGSTVKTSEDKFEFDIDVQYFAPSEVSVNVEDGFVVVDAKHEEKKDEHGFVSRQLVRRYPIPDGVEPEDVVAHLSSDGILTVSAPRKAEDNSDRPVPIIPTGPKRKAKEITCDNGNCSN